MKTLLLLVLLFAPLHAFAQACGVGGTAKAASGVVVTRTDAQATQDSVRVGFDGYWWKCALPKPKTDLNCRMSSPQRPYWWGKDGSFCQSSQTVKGPKKHGEVFTVATNRNGVLGYKRLRCDDGILVTETSWCIKR